MSQQNYIDKLRRALEADGGSLAFPFVRSAVIVPLLIRDGTVEIVFELRSRHLRRSPGEVGFPGGRIEAGENPWQAALRELEEELGVPGDQVEYLGQLPEQQRRRNELVVPFVAGIGSDAVLQPDGIEVEEVFTLPLDHLLGNEMRQARIVEWHTLSEDFPLSYLPGGVWNRTESRTLYYLIYRDYLIWGLSANILRRLVQLIR